MSAVDGKKVIVIKKVKKGHGGHHGGSWKVAYADFVTAMMAFFLVMWILGMDKLHNFKSGDPSSAIVDFFVSGIRDLVCAIA